VNSPQSRPILLLGSQMAVAGAQRVLLDQADWFHEHGQAVTAVFFYDRDGLEAIWKRTSSYPLLSLNAWQKGGTWIRNLVSLVKGLFHLWHLLKKERFAAVETFTHHSNLIGMPFAWFAGVPVRVATHHGRIEAFPRFLEILHTWIINSRLTTCLVAVSERVRQEAIQEGITPEKIVVIPNGIKLPLVDIAEVSRIRKELKLDPSQHLVISVGRLTYQKAHTYLLKAAPSVLARFPDTIFAIAGEGPLRRELENEAAHLKISEQVKLLGVRSDVSTLMAAADVFVLPSRWEGMPMVLLEAMGSSAPVVVTRVEGVDEIVEDGQNGLTVEPENAALLAEAILRLLLNGNERRQLGTAARSKIETGFTLDYACWQYAQILLPGLKSDAAAVKGYE
jgi:glycosyltransferase involved in cell wall biosynthesis